MNMAYWCSGASNDELVQKMVDNKIITSERVAKAFRRVDRANYVLDKRDAYRDSPQAIKCNATISAPHMHAHAAETLLPFLFPGARVLDVGSGSGYICALFHKLVSDADTQEQTGSDADQSSTKGKGKVIGIDHMAPLVSSALDSLRSDGLASELSSGSIEIVIGDGREGWLVEAPYDAIHVGAAAPGPNVPEKLIEQLKAPGRMFIPVGTDSQKIIVVDKDEEGNVTEKAILDVVYVPLTDHAKQAAGRF